MSPLSTSTKNTVTCKYNNIGFCKFEDNCKYVHYVTNCSKQQCKTKSCQKRHPKICRYRNKCKRINSCKYLHQENQILTLKIKEEKEQLILETNKLRSEIENLKLQNITLEEQIHKYKQEIFNLSETKKDKIRLTNENNIIKNKNKELKENKTNMIMEIAAHTVEITKLNKKFEEFVEEYKMKMKAQHGKNTKQYNTRIQDLKKERDNAEQEAFDLKKKIEKIYNEKN